MLDFVLQDINVVKTLIVMVFLLFLSIILFISVLISSFYSFKLIEFISLFQNNIHIKPWSFWFIYIPYIGTYWWFYIVFKIHKEIKELLFKNSSCRKFGIGIVCVYINLIFLTFINIIGVCYYFIDFEKYNSKNLYFSSLIISFIFIAATTLIHYIKLIRAYKKVLKIKELEV